MTDGSDGGDGDGERRRKRRKSRQSAPLLKEEQELQDMLAVTQGEGKMKILCASI